MKTKIRHKYPIGATLLDTYGVEHVVTGVRRSDTGHDMYDVRQATLGLATYTVRHVDENWVEPPMPIQFVNVYRTYVGGSHSTREGADASAEREPNPRLARLAVYDNGRVELVEEGQDED